MRKVTAIEYDPGDIIRFYNTHIFNPQWMWGIITSVSLKNKERLYKVHVFGINQQLSIKGSDIYVLGYVYQIDNNKIIATNSETFKKVVYDIKGKKLSKKRRKL